MTILLWALAAWAIPAAAAEDGLMGRPLETVPVSAFLETARKVPAPRVSAATIAPISHCELGGRVEQFEGGPPPTGNRPAVNEALFNAIIDRVRDLYAPLVARRFRKTLVFTRYWSGDRVDACSGRDGDFWEIGVSGALARHRAMTPDAFALTLCHELGHHLGGSPKNGRLDAPWAVPEGQADYYASLKCMRRYLAGVGNAAAPEAAAPAAVARACRRSFRDDRDAALCRRSALAGSALARMHWIQHPIRLPPPDFETPDGSRNFYTRQSHPSPQCRLDTYFAGAVCARSADEELSDVDPAAGACTAPEPGARPACWYLEPGGNR